MRAVAKLVWAAPMSLRRAASTPLQSEANGLRAMLNEAADAMGDTAVVAAETLGEDHRIALVLEAKAARLTLERGGGSEALKAAVAHMAHIFGDEHFQTAKYKAALQAGEATRREPAAPRRRSASPSELPLRWLACDACCMHRHTGTGTGPRSSPDVRGGLP